MPTTTADGHSITLRPTVWRSPFGSSPADLGNQLGRHLQRPHRVGSATWQRRALRVGAQRLAVGQRCSRTRSWAICRLRRRVRAALGRRREAVVLVVRNCAGRRISALSDAAVASPPPDRWLSCTPKLSSRGATCGPARRLQPRVDQRHLERLDAELPDDHAAPLRCLSVTS